MSVTVVDSRGKYDRLLRDIASLRGAYMTVGIHGDDAGREDGGSNVLIGAVHEFGAPGHKPPIPQRAFLRPGVALAAPEIARVATEGLRGVIAGTERPKRVIEQMGNAAVAGVHKRIDSNIAPALARSTMEKRIRRTQKGRKALNMAAKYSRLLSRSGYKFVKRNQPFGKGTWKQQKVTEKTVAVARRSFARANRLMSGRFTALVDTGQLRQSITYKAHVGVSS